MELEEVEEAWEAEDEEQVQKTVEIEDRSLRRKIFWWRLRYPTPGCFANVCQKKGDAGASVRIYVKARGMGEICLEMEEGERKRGATVRMTFEYTCASVYC